MGTPHIHVDNIQSAEENQEQVLPSEVGSWERSVLERVPRCRTSRPPDRYVGFLESDHVGKKIKPPFPCLMVLPSLLHLLRSFCHGLGHCLVTLLNMAGPPLGGGFCGGNSLPLTRIPQEELSVGERMVGHGRNETWAIGHRRKLCSENHENKEKSPQTLP